MIRIFIYVYIYLYIYIQKHNMNHTKKQYRFTVAVIISPSVFKYGFELLIRCIMKIR